MPSPFPGMDPFLECHNWRDFHGDFIVAIRAALVPLLLPRYVALIEDRVYIDTMFEPARCIVPDLTIAERRAQYATARPRDTGAVVPVLVPLPMPENVRESFIEVRAQESREVVAVIEVLSPTNKRPGSKGRREYLAKRKSVISSPAHLIEIDLLRGGERLPMGCPLPPADYYVIVSRAKRRPEAQVWAFTLRHRLPEIPVPLAGTDPDVKLDLQSALDTVYDRAGYRQMINYESAVEPPLNGSEAEWVREALSARTA